MFENFVHFQEVTKLSSIVYYQMKEVNYDVNLLRIICDKNDSESLKEIFDLITYMRYEIAENICSNENLCNTLLNCFLKHPTLRRSLLEYCAPLHYSCKYGNLKVLKYIVEESTELKIPIIDLLNMACLCNHLEIVKYIVKKDINIRNEETMRIAIFNSKEEIVNYLSSKGFTNRLFQPFHNLF